ncbi:MFS transporter [Bacillus sp. J37]|uniref:MFS transporter n=1 Tax=Bacillus sp. J37 TaxID=935837 RepID=UPI0004B16838|nr:MFS transporter [Bacillus sp. J37]HWK22163.1 MFS transporter [Ureibacillus sp.]
MTSDIEVQKLPLYDHILFILITFIYWFSLYIYVPVFVSYLDYLGGTYTFVGFIVGSYGIMQILLRLPVGVVSDRLQIRKPFLIAGLVTGVISCLGFALTESIEFALVSRFISGITASMWVAFTVLYASYFKQEDTTRAMGNVQFITVASQLISMGLSGYLVTQWGWKSPFWIGGFVGIFGIVLALRIKESKQKKSESKKIRMSELNEVLREPTVLKAAILSALAHAVLFITMFGFTPDYALKIGASKESLIFLVGSFMIPHAIAPIITGRYLAGHFQKWKILVVGFFGTFAFSVIIPFINNLGFLYLTQAFNGFAQGMTIPLLMGMAIQTIPNRKRATAMGLFQAVYAIGIFLGPFISGLFSEEGTFLPVFLTAGAAGIIGMLLSLKWRYQHSPLSKKKIESM